MKKLLIMTGVLLALTASLASAAGIDLNWNNCLNNATVRVQDQSFNCDDSAPGAGDANLNFFFLDGSVRSAVALQVIKAWGADIDIQTAAPVLDPYWQDASGDCRAGSLGTFSFSGFTTTDTKGCNGTLMVSTPPAFPVSNYFDNVGGPNRARLNMGCTRTSGVTVNANVKYLLFKASLDSRFTKVDPTDPSNGDHACAGCLDPVCLVLNHVELDSDPGTNSADGKTHFYTQEVANFVTWQGGTIGGNGCPAATPTRKATWGAVKSLYR